MPVSFERLRAEGVLGPLHVALAESLRRLDRETADEVLLAAALASEQLGRGHVCLTLDSLPSISFASPHAESGNRSYTDWPEPDHWNQALQESALVTAVDSTSPCSDEITTPLVYDIGHRRVYLSRYWYYERTLAGLIRRRMAADLRPVDELRIRQDIDRLFPDRETAAGRDQALAAANSVDRSFAVITGGPGTGKTTTVARILALHLLRTDLSGNDAAADSPPRVLLMAPTGKAAQRLNDSLRRAAARLPVSEAVRSVLADVSAGTIHRILGWTPLPPERGGPFRHSEDHPLNADIVIVDEASMIDLGLMCRLFQAVPDHACLILMGDRHQLASVEAGGILGDLCGNAGDAAVTVSQDRLRTLESRTGLNLHCSDELRIGDSAPDADIPPLNESIVALTFSHRFSAESAAGQLAERIRCGDEDAVITLLKSAGEEDRIHWLQSHDFDVSLNELVRQAAARYAHYLQLLRENPADSRKIPAALNQQRVLCAHRDGPAGESTLNRRITEQLASMNLLQPTGWNYVGRPLMVTGNDYQLNLFNGDTGVVVPQQGDSSLPGNVVLFEDPEADCGVRSIPESLVSTAQDCFAMTIHKSQGSEFPTVLLALPPTDSPILSRELLYTAVTRIKDQTNPDSGTVRPGELWIAAPEAVLRSAVRRQIRRTSGIRDAIGR